MARGVGAERFCLSGDFNLLLGDAQGGGGVRGLPWAILLMKSEGRPGELYERIGCRATSTWVSWDSRLEEENTREGWRGERVVMEVEREEGGGRRGGGGCCWWWWSEVGGQEAVGLRECSEMRKGWGPNSQRGIATRLGSLLR